MQNALPLYTVAQIRAKEQALVRSRQISWAQLMEEAAASLWSVLQPYAHSHRRWLVVCGAGNNGGDGWVLARIAKTHGVDVRVVCTLDVDALEGLPAEVAKAAVEVGVPVDVWSAVSPSALPEADLLVDALLGIGFAGELRSPLDAMITAINAHPAMKVAVDLPSGLVADTGASASVAVQADVTITFIARKVGLHTAEGRALSGVVVLRDLGDAASDEVSPVAYLYTAPWHSRLPARSANAHKGQLGHVFVAGGDERMFGASVLAAKAAYRMGAGKVTVLARSAHVAALVAACPSCMVAPLTVEQKNVQATWPASTYNVGLLGPGMGRTPVGEALYQQVLASFPDEAVQDRALVMDADALYWLAQDQGQSLMPWAVQRRVITPHPGEAATLLRCQVAEIQADRLQAAQCLAVQYDAVCVLKGAGTVVAEKERLPCILPVGNAGLAKGGTGDVLAGMIAALLAQGLPAWEAAVMGVGVHGRAADLAAQVLGERALMADDLMGCFNWI